MLEAELRQICLSDEGTRCKAIEAAARRLPPVAVKNSDRTRWRGSSEAWPWAPNPLSRIHILSQVEDPRSSMATTKKKKTKSRPVTSGSKQSTPGPSTSLNLKLPLDENDSNAKSNSGTDLTPRDLTPQPSSSSSSARPTAEPEPGLVLDVIGTPALPSQSSTPAPLSELKPKANGPAVASPPIPASQPTPTMTPKRPDSTARAPFSVGEEFIAFGFSDSDEETAAMPIREWDQGKASGDVEKRGKKRKAGEISRENREYDRDGRREGHHRDRDGDGEMRQRMRNVPRCAPWVANVDWDKCTNVPEL